jgi:hypothetical protein
MPPSERGGNAGADEDQVGSELLHEVELALGPVKGLAALRLGQAFKVSERLEEGDAEAKIGHHRRHIARGMVIGQEIILENLDPGKAGGGNRLEFFAQIAADRHGCNRRFHGRSPPFERRVRTS